MTLPDLFHDRLCLPLVAAPMFLVSGPQMVAQCCMNGVVGTFPALNRRTTGDFAGWLEQIETVLTAFESETGRCPAPFGVNLIVHKSNPRLQADLAVCIEHRVPLVITSLGAVTDLVETVHGYGGLVFHDVINRRHAEKAAAAGVDGIIAVCAGAGGHAGTLNPFALLAEIRQVFAGTLLLAGCINSGRDIAAALQMGADLAYSGTRFIGTVESMADESYKKMLLRCGAADIVYTPAVSGVAGNFMAPSLASAGFDSACLARQQTGQMKPVGEESAAWKTVWSAGQGCGSIRDIPTVEALIRRMRAEFAEALQDMGRRAAPFNVPP